MMISRRFFLLCFFSLLMMPLGTPLFAAVEIKVGNPGFEDTLGGTGNWDITSNRGISRVTGAGAPQGNSFLRLDEGATVALGFSGVFTFQTVENVKPGDFVSFGGLVRVNTLDGGDAAQLLIEFQTDLGGVIDATNIAQINAVNGAFQRVRTSARAPAGTEQVTFTIRIQPSNAGGGTQADFDDIQATVNSSPIFLQASPSSDVATPGEMNMLTMRLENTAAVDFTGAQVVAEPGSGIRILPNNGRLDGEVIGSEEGSVIFNVGTLLANQSSVFTAPFLLTSGILPGRSYEIVLYVRNAAQGNISQTVRVLVRAELDPVFQEGTIIGKVFHDGNKNGMQDSGEHGEEYGIPGVRIYTEEGIGVTTDHHGKYSIPGVKPGRHVLKIDGHTVPEGAQFITEEAYLIKTTPGILNKVNFAVFLPEDYIPEKFDEDLAVSISQGLDISKPVLDVTASPDVLRLGVGRLAQNPTFQFRLNYPDFIKNWYLEIRDDLGQVAWSGFGVGAPPSEVQWTGHDEFGAMVTPGVYSYQLKVEDTQGHQDWTVLKFLRIISANEPKEAETFPIELAPVGDFNLFKDGKRHIPLVAKPTLHIQGETKPENEVIVNGYPTDVDPVSGKFSTELYTSAGEKEVIVVTTDPEGESVRYHKTVTVKDSTFFMVGLAEEEFGVNFQGGDFQTAAEDDHFKDGFYQDGRLSFYLKGKLRGKFLVKAHYDTDDKRSALMTNLDQDDYYPVYGDSSTRDYEAQDTLSRLFVVVEMDRSFAKWGSFRTNFNDTELATYNRTVNGLKVHYETMTHTPYGDPKSELSGFVTESRHKSDHNEFLATGGALYYLRQRGLIEGGEQVRVEIRDKIQGTVIHTYDLVEGSDYDIDYDEGRILLSKPLSSVAASDTLVNLDILDGSPVYLVVDYEYDAGSNAFVDGNRGLRGSTHFGDHLKIGGTYVQERRRNSDYDLRGIDMTVKLGRNTKITAEYAESISESVDHAVSFNGGLSFANLEQLRGSRTRDREYAYLVKAESKPTKNLELSGFVQNVEPGFSTDSTRSQEGFKKLGLSARYKIGKYASLRYRFDRSEVSDALVPFHDNNISGPFENYRAHTVQLGYDDGKWVGDLEYRYQNVLLPEDNLQPNILSEIPFRNGGALKLGYRLNDRLLPYARIQISGKGKENNQWGGGLRYNVTDSVSAYIEHLFGNIGDSTLFGFERSDQAGHSSYANIRMFDRGIGSKLLTTAIGNSFRFSDRSRLFTEREYSLNRGAEGYADIVGYEAKITERWSAGARYERRHLNNATTRILDLNAQESIGRANSHNTISGTLSYDDKRKLKVRTYLEGRIDTDAPKMWQWLSRTNAGYKVNEDLEFLGKLDFGKSRFTDPADTPADFFEMSSGFAYRPVKNDKLNILGRYSYLRNKGSDVQFGSALFGGIEVDERSHIIAVDLAYDIHRYLGIVEKFAYKNSILHSSVGDAVILHNVLWINRANFHVTRKWDIALEYRALWQQDALNTFKHGALVEVDREIYDYARIGLGYNFTDFNDDLAKTTSYDTNGPFVRMTGKF